MSSTIQIRNVPDGIHRKLKSRATLAGLSLSDYLLRELRRSLDRPTREELLERILHRTSLIPNQSLTAMVRRERGRP
jgi:antitoxin FitA